MNYYEYLKTEEWKKRRKARIALDGGKCRLCDSPDELNVHHRPEAYNRLGHEHVDDDLITLCKRCHALVHDKVYKEQIAVYNSEETKKEDYMIACLLSDITLRKTYYAKLKTLYPLIDKNGADIIEYICTRDEINLTKNLLDKYKKNAIVKERLIKIYQLPVKKYGKAVIKQVIGLIEHRETSEE